MCLLPHLFWFALYSLAAAKEGGEHWCYLSQKCEEPECKEPRQWDQLHSECGNGNQSPINILTRKVEYNWSLAPFRFENYNTKNSIWTLLNNGHTVQVELDGSAKIESGGLQGKYKAVQFHFHWGNDDGQKTNKRISPGSEHSIDGERYAMELHIVHIKEQFNDIKAALAGNGVAVLGFFIELGEWNDNYTPLISLLKNISFKGSRILDAAVFWHNQEQLVDGGHFSPGPASGKSDRWVGGWEHGMVNGLALSDSLYIYIKLMDESYYGARQQSSLHKTRRQIRQAKDGHSSATLRHSAASPQCPRLPNGHFCKTALAQNDP
ncbi:hypothetical protein JRQ81_008143 [Phrynocephalus forsythii]|uniref:Carbonic anhydrase n=1 Tax=Phrynocephalus forsythii TaxID=171643 RepID=A0A9Q0XDE0_9SAUR|nr:hypothetical protein JRQ81_008143 [Phrynocephalus forsythii]